MAQLVAKRLGTGEVLGSNPGKGENFSVKIKESLRDKHAFMFVVVSSLMFTFVVASDSLSSLRAKV